MLRPTPPHVRAALEAATEKYQAALDNEARNYLAGRGLDGVAESLRFGRVVDPEPGHERMRGRLAIPYLGKSGVYGLRFRSLHGEDPKYLGTAGAELRIYNVQALHLAGEDIHVTEGEIDAASLQAAGLHAVGFPGAKSVKPHHARLFAGFSRVYVWPDGDSAGRDFAEKLARDIDSAVVVPMPDGMDVNQILIDQGREALLSMAV